MQIATIEFARNVLKLAKAHSTEFEPATPHPVIAMLDEQRKVTKKGGTMRLGAQPCQLTRRLEGGGSFTARSSSTNATATATNSTTPTAKIREGRFCFQRPVARRQARRGHRTEGPSVFHREPVPSGIFEQAAPAASAVQGLHRRRAPAHPPQAALAEFEAQNEECNAAYAAAIEFLYGLRLFGANFGLENTFQLAALAGNPQEKLRFIHVAGTNGKGSTCAMLESIYRAAGLRVGLFTSPHLVSFRERIQVNRQLIPKATWSGWSKNCARLKQFSRRQSPDVV
jgi:hypothetical protein